MLPLLQRPREYQDTRKAHFATLSALQYYLKRRRVNGLLESGAVVESPIGLRINPSVFDAWLLGRVPSRRAGADTAAAA